MARIISSQHYLSDEIVAAKRSAADYEVMVSPLFLIEGEAMRVVIDGHHSLAAARQDSIDPVYVEATSQDHDAVALLAGGNIEDFLAICWMDGDYYDIATGAYVW